MSLMDACISTFCSLMDCIIVPMIKMWGFTDVLSYKIDLRAI